MKLKIELNAGHAVSKANAKTSLELVNWIKQPIIHSGIFIPSNHFNPDCFIQTLNFPPNPAPATIFFLLVQLFCLQSQLNQVIKLTAIGIAC